MALPFSSKQPSKRIQPWWVTALQLSIAGLEPVDIAAKTGRSKRAVNMCLASEWAQSELERFNQLVMDRVVASRVDPISKFQGLLGRAIDKLEQNLDCGDPKVEHLAACRIVDNAGYAPVKRVHVTEEDALRGLSTEELQEVARTGRLPHVSRPAIEAHITGDDNESHSD